jgi:hypothetical protein
MWEVRYHPAADEERKQLPTKERTALANVVEKLEVHGPLLPHPHQSRVIGSYALRELRPRAGRSPWRAFYRRFSDVFVIGAIGPEAQVDKRKFARAVDEAARRLDEVEVS